MSDNSRGVGNLLMDLLTVGGDDILTLFNVGGVNDGLASLAGNLARVLLGDFMALPILFVLAFWTSRVSLAGLSLSFSFTLTNSISSISTISMSYNLRVMANNCGRMV